jgi:hypothetical protein
MEQPRIRGLIDWRLLALGGHAVVWAACQLSLDRWVAVKVYRSELQDDGRHPFLREAAAAGRLSGLPGIVPTYDAGILPDDRPYLMMELCPGGSLDEWLEPANRASEERVCHVGVRLADAVAAVHASGMLHGDVRPSNILIDSYGDPKLADFGQAAVVGAEDAPAVALRVHSAYAPPEAFRTARPTEAGDIYSLAATLYALLACRAPRSVDDAAATPDSPLVLAQRPIASLNGVSPALMDMLLTALDDDPSARPRAVELRAALLKVDRAPGLLAGAGGYRGVTALPQRESAAPHSLDGAARAKTFGGSPSAERPAASKESPRHRGRRRAGGAALAAAALVAVLASTTSWLVGERAASGGSASVAPTPSASGPAASGASSPASGSVESGSAEANAIQVVRSADATDPFEIVRIQGLYRGGADTMVRIQRWEDGEWRAFPIPAKTDQSGGFNAYVELGKAGRYRLRVQDPATGATSEPFVLEVQN